MGDFRAGFEYGLSGLSRLFGRGTRSFVVIPLAINALLFSLAIVWSGSRLSQLIDMIESEMPSYLSWAAWLLWPLFVVFALLIVFFGFTLIANLIGSPFNGVLAERIEDRDHPDNRRPPARGISQEIIAAPLNELRKLLYFALLAVPLLALLLFPPVYPLLPFLWFAYGAWVLAVEYLDFPMANWALSLPEQRQILRRHRMLTLGFGTAVTLMTMIPVVNFVAMPAAVIGATRLWSDRLNHRRTNTGPGDAGS